MLLNKKRGYYSARCVYLSQNYCPRLLEVADCSRNPSHTKQGFRVRRSNEPAGCELRHRYSGNPSGIHKISCKYIGKMVHFARRFNSGYQPDSNRGYLIIAGAKCLMLQYYNLLRFAPVFLQLPSRILGTEDLCGRGSIKLTDWTVRLRASIWVSDANDFDGSNTGSIATLLCAACSPQFERR